MTSPQDPFAAPGDQPPAQGQPPAPPSQGQPAGYGTPPPGYGPPPGYPPPYAQVPYASQKTNTMAIVGFILTLVICPPIGAILCFIALGQIKRTGEGGRGLALAGIWICVAMVVVFVGVVASAAMVSGVSTGY